MGNTTCDGNYDRNNNIAAKKPRVSLGVDNRKEDVTEQIKEQEEHGWISGALYCIGSSTSLYM